MWGWPCSAVTCCCRWTRWLSGSAGVVSGRVGPADSPLQTRQKPNSSTHLFALKNIQNIRLLFEPDIWLVICSWSRYLIKESFVRTKIHVLLLLYSYSTRWPVPVYFSIFFYISNSRIFMCFVMKFFYSKKKPAAYSAGNLTFFNIRLLKKVGLFGRIQSIKKAGLFSGYPVHPFFELACMWYTFLARLEKYCS